MIDREGRFRPGLFIAVVLLAVVALLFFRRSRPVRDGFPADQPEADQKAVPEVVSPRPAAEPESPPASESVMPVVADYEPEEPAPEDVLPAAEPESPPASESVMPVPADPLPDLFPEDGPLVLDKIPEGTFYASTAVVSGWAPGMRELSWTSARLDTGGRVSAGDDGRFELTISTYGFSDVLDVAVSGMDSDGILRRAGVFLFSDGVGPSLVVDSPVRGDFYTDLLRVQGRVGPGPYDPEDLSEVEAVLWSLEGEEQRQLLFDASGYFELTLDMFRRSGDEHLLLEAVDLNGNSTVQDILLRDGRGNPELSIYETETGTAGYGAGFLLEGRAADYYTDEDFPEGTFTVSYEVYSLDNPELGPLDSGELEVSASEFSRLLDTGEFSGRLEVVVTATGRNGGRAVDRRELVPGRSAIPTFRISSGDRVILADWQQVPRAASYVVTVADDAGEIVQQITGKTRAVIPNLENGRIYEVSVEALREPEPAVSHPLKGVPLSSRTLLPEAVGEFRRIRVTWPVVPASDVYTVFRADGSGGLFEPVAGNVEGGIFVDTSVRFGRRYRYSVALGNFDSILSDFAEAESLAFQGSNLERIAFLEDLVPRALRVAGDYLMAVTAEEFAVVDVFEPFRPVVVGHVDVPGAEDVAVLGEYAYVAAGKDGLKIIGIADPVRPLVVGVRLAGDARAVDVAGSHAYIADARKGLRVLDVSSARAPFRLSAAGDVRGLDVLLSGKTAFLAADGDGLLAFNVEDPAQPEELWRQEAPGARVLRLMGDLLAVGGADGVRLFDVSSPADPVFLAWMPLEEVTGLSFKGDYLLSAGNGTLNVLDVHVPEQVRVFRTYGVKDVQDMAFYGYALILGASAGIEIFQTYLLGASFVVDDIKPQGHSYGVRLTGDLLAIASHGGGVSVWEAETHLPVRIYPTNFARAAVLDDEGIVVADGPHGLRRISGETGRDDLFGDLGTVKDVVSLDGTAYGASEDGILILKPGLGQVPDLLSFEGCNSVDAAGGFLLAAGQDEVRLYRLVPDSGPALVDSARVEGVRDVSLDGTAAAAAGNDGVSLFRIEEGEAAKLVLVSLISSDSARAVLVQDGNLYLSAGFRGLWVYDIRDPKKFRLMTLCDEVFAFETAVYGDTAYVADGKNVNVVALLFPDWLR